MDKACSFTGHRQIKTDHIPHLGALLDRAIKYAYAKGCRTFYTGGAIGFDTYAAREIIRMRITHPDIRLVILIPCYGQDALWSESQRDAYNHILTNADEVRYISEEYTPDCMKLRNKVLVEEADILIAYLSRSRSGAGQTVRIAQKLGREVYNLYPTLEEAAKQE